MGNIGIYLTTILLGSFVSSTSGIKHIKTYVGCYADNMPRVFPEYHKDAGHTVDGCFNKAVELGLEMFAIQNGGECWLDSAKNNNFDRYGATDRCKGAIGGKWANSVYRIKSFCTRQTEEGICCVFPFYYDSKYHYSCIKDNHDQEWCSTTSNYERDGDWGNCVDPCESGWSYFNNHCYKLFSKISTFGDAQRKCQSIGADLAKVTSRLENNFVGQMLPKMSNAWIGLQRQEDKKFYWTDGSAPSSYVYWGKNEPNNVEGVEDCTEMRRVSHVWNDIKCSKQLSYVCEKAL